MPFDQALPDPAAGEPHARRAPAGKNGGPHPRRVRSHQQAGASARGVYFPPVAAASVNQGPGGQGRLRRGKVSTCSIFGPLNTLRVDGIEMSFGLEQTITAIERMFVEAAKLKNDGHFHSSPPSLRFVDQAERGTRRCRAARSARGASRIRWHTRARPPRAWRCGGRSPWRAPRRPGPRSEATAGSSESDRRSSASPPPRTSSRWP